MNMHAHIIVLHLITNAMNSGFSYVFWTSCTNSDCITQVATAPMIETVVVKLSIALATTTARRAISSPSFVVGEFRCYADKRI
jgi:hypothetical protein